MCHMSSSLKHGRETDRTTDRQKLMQPDREIDRLTDRHTGRQRD